MKDTFLDRLDGCEWFRFIFYYSADGTQMMRNDALEAF